MLKKEKKRKMTKKREKRKAKERKQRNLGEMEIFLITAQPLKFLIQ